MEKALHRDAVLAGFPLSPLFFQRGTGCALLCEVMS